MLTRRLWKRDPPCGPGPQRRVLDRNTERAGPVSPGERPASSPDRLVVFRPDRPNSQLVNDLLEDRAGRIWCGNNFGVYSIDPKAANPRLTAVDVGMPGKTWEDSTVNALAEDSEGAIWMGIEDGTIYRRLPDGRVEH